MGQTLNSGFLTIRLKNSYLKQSVFEIQYPSLRTSAFVRMGEMTTIVPYLYCWHLIRLLHKTY